jgi:hypothetical protein
LRGHAISSANFLSGGEPSPALAGEGRPRLFRAVDRQDELLHGFGRGLDRAV